MPIYEYRCESCGQELEKIQKFSDPALKDCPKCGEPALIKLVSASSFRLKGTGWYETDFKTGKKKNGVSDSNSEGSSESSDSAKSKSENKTEGKTESKAESKKQTNASAKADSNK